MEENNKLIELVNKGLNNVEIGKIIGCDRNTVRRRLVKYGIDKPIKKAHPDLKVDYFKVINDKNKAYWLGFLMADGHVTKDKNRVVIDLKSTDKDWIIKFCLEVGGNIDKIRYRLHKKGYESLSLSITNSNFTKHLISHGCINNKSLILEFNELVSDELNLAFLMGYYDGDGDAKGCTLYCGSINFLESIKKEFKIKFDIKQKGGVYAINLGAEFKRKLMKNYPDSLPRKRFTYNGDKGFKTNDTQQHRERKVERPPFPILIEEIKELGYRGTGKKYGVSDNSIRKWKKYYEKDFK